MRMTKTLEYREDKETNVVVDEIFIEEEHNMLSVNIYHRKRVNKHIKHKFNTGETKSMEIEVEYVAKLINCLLNGKIVIFIDEMTFNSRSYPEYLRIKDSSSIASNCKSAKITNSIIAACTFNEVIIFRVFDVTVDSETFGSFILALINHYIVQQVNLNDLVIILDNAPTHRAKKISCLSPFVHFLWLPAYSPHLNFIERLFSLWKAHIKKMLYRESGKDYHNMVLKALISISADSCKKKSIDQLVTYQTVIKNNGFFWQTKEFDGIR